MSKTPAPTGAAPEVQVMTDPEGEPLFAVIPWKHWTAVQAALEDARDAALLDRFHADLEAGREELVPVEIGDAIAAGDSPIRVWRDHRGLTQKGLAEAAGLKQAYVSELESGRKTNPPIDTALRLARALAVDLDDLFPAVTVEAEAASTPPGVVDVD